MHLALFVPTHMLLCFRKGYLTLFVCGNDFPVVLVTKADVYHTSVFVCHGINNIKLSAPPIVCHAISHVKDSHQQTKKNSFGLFQNIDHAMYTGLRRVHGKSNMRHFLVHLNSNAHAHTQPDPGSTKHADLRD